ncbi:hypothetical protein AMAG_12317 [Allomyces macrogynus ATCC 38327]|uniref:Uncharacterized protein n=1 Tax=Allomyces macrogynus (strain ATCC 38327) TaxID=578462 RepID=A0A0L0SXL1_ALLM3|nr:hypothetical protein AMAG_12317 [Allomyces macrogynus ATCC 38327]|eukprot:KNE67247.1 hypothetical protein AMAG_12317 [Allomyces macrogynus ATCC 38327]
MKTGRCSPLRWERETSTLEQLPHDILRCIAKVLQSFDDNPNQQVPSAAVYLALASPHLYAPILDVAIHSGTKHPVVRLLHGDGCLASIQRKMTGRFAVFDEVVGNGKPVLFLILPPRDGNRASIQSGISTTIQVSRKWTLLPVHFGRIRGRFVVTDETPIFTFPQGCRSLEFDGRSKDWFPWHRLSGLPHSLKELSIRNLEVFPKVETSAISDPLLVLSSLPPTLRRLHLSNTGYYGRHGSSGQAERDTNGNTVWQLCPWSAVLACVPNTLEELDLVTTSGSSPLPLSALPTLAWLVARLPRLKSFGMTCHDDPELSQVLYALPRTGMQRLALSIHHQNGQDPSACAQLASAMPAAVESLELKLTNMFTPQVAALVIGLPVVSHSLTLHFDAVLEADHFRLIPLAPALKSIDISCEQGPALDGNDIACLLARLPAPLTHLKLRNMRLGGTQAIPTLAKNMPPRLVVLQLPLCEISNDDLDVISTTWPDTLLHLDVSDTNSVPPPLTESPLAAGMLELKFIDHAKWSEKMPMGLRMLSVNGLPVTNGTVVWLVECMRKHTARKKTKVIVGEQFVSQAALEFLMNAFDVELLRTKEGRRGRRRGGNRWL